MARAAEVERELSDPKTLRDPYLNPNLTLNWVERRMTVGIDVAAPAPGSARRAAA